MSGDTTALISEICITSSSAATRGIKFLPERRRRREHMAVTEDTGVAGAGKADDQRRQVFGEPVIERGIVGEEDLGDAGDLCRRLGDPSAVFAGDEDVHLAPGLLGDLRGGGDGRQRRRLQRRVVVFGNNQNRHQITRASFFNLSTSSATEPTLIPPWRLAGSSTLSVMRRGVTSTPSSSGVIGTIGFFFAFMMLGSEA